MKNIRLNLGCGPYPIKGCVNVDSNPHWKPDLLRDVRRGLPYEDGTVTEIIATHFFEHLTPVELLDLLEEIYRVLVPGGTMRIAVPLGTSGSLDHWTTFSERSFDALHEPDVGAYHRRNFRWDLRRKEVLQDDPKWSTETLHATLAVVKDRGPLLVDFEQRTTILRNLVGNAGSAFDVGCGNTFSGVYGDRQFTRLLGINPFAPYITEMQTRHRRENWEFRVQDVREYIPEKMWDVVTMLHVAEHLDLWDLAEVLNRIVPRSNKFVLETPEQYDSNARTVAERQNVWERHRSLVTADFLSQWQFVPAYRYWVNDQFSNVIYTRSQ